MRIAIVDDEPAIRFALEELFAGQHEVTCFDGGGPALASLIDEPADLVISDYSMPGMNGLDLLARARELFPESLFVLVTAHGDERTAVQALKAGAWDYIPKPFENDEMLAMARRAAELLALRAENGRLRRELIGDVEGMIGVSDAIRSVRRMIELAAPTDASVLITGESGTGKELVARAIHAKSRRSRLPFVALNASAVASSLAESELFGHVRGAFTGADRPRDGLFVAADRGTLLLDEIAELDATLQAKLLRVLEDRTVTPVGSSESRPVDVRIIAATNGSLHEMVEAGEFRRDLLYRLEVIHIEIQPLRTRREDVPLLASHFLHELAVRHRRPGISISEDASRRLAAWEWPGNVRELRNTIERAVVMSESDVIGPEALPEPVRRWNGGMTGPDSASADLPYAEARDRAVRQFHQTYLAAALARHDGNVSATARALGVHRQSLQKMLQKLRC